MLTNSFTSRQDCGYRYELYELVRLRGPNLIVPTFHSFDPSWASLGQSEVAEGLSGRLGVWYPCGYELVAWYGREHTRLVLRRSLTSLRPSVRREARENGRRNIDLQDDHCGAVWTFEGEN